MKSKHQRISENLTKQLGEINEARARLELKPLSFRELTALIPKHINFRKIKEELITYNKGLEYE